MIKIENNQNITITKSGIYEINIVSNSQVVIEYTNSEDINVELDVNIADDVKTTILCLNHASAKVSSKENYIVNRDSELVLSYCELNMNKFEHDTVVSLLGKGAISTVQSATVCKDDIRYNILCKHKAPYTQSQMNNYGIVVNSSKCEMVVTGSILKGNYQSKSHQISRLMTFDDNPKVNALPVLLIEENDVEASHAMSLGQPDENQMYYMASRGINKKEALRLITIGYLLPIIDVIDDEDLKKQLKEEIELRVQECEM